VEVREELQQTQEQEKEKYPHLLPILGNNECKMDLEKEKESQYSGPA
jgi:hypothetical protein